MVLRDMFTFSPPLRRAFPGVCLPLALACSASTPEASSSSDKSAGPGADCLAHAAAERTPPANAPERIEVSHILVRHAELERPEGATRSPEDACLRALEARAALQGGESWNAAVEQFSDSGVSTHGDLGRISQQEVTPSFGNAAFSLEVDELSYVVESDRGFHIILRTE